MGLSVTFSHPPKTLIHIVPGAIKYYRNNLMYRVLGSTTLFEFVRDPSVYLRSFSIIAITQLL